MTRRAARTGEPGGDAGELRVEHDTAVSGGVDFFAGAAPPWISKHDARYPLRKPGLYAEVLRTDDRALLCGVTSQMLDEAAGGPLELRSFIARVTDACAEGEQRQRLGEIVNRVPLHDLADFVGHVRRRRRAMSAP